MALRSFQHLIVSGAVCVSHPIHTIPSRRGQRCISLISLDRMTGTCHQALLRLRGQFLGVNFVIAMTPGPNQPVLFAFLPEGLSPDSDAPIPASGFSASPGTDPDHHAHPLSLVFNNLACFPADLPISRRF